MAAMERARLPFADRRSAGRALAQRLLAAPPGPHPLVLALPRGGVPVAWEIARALQAPLELLLVRKIGCPGQPELACAALVEGDPPELVLNDELMADEPPARAWLAAAVAAETAVLAERRRAWRGGRPLPPVAGRCVILVDDGLATGTTVRAALAALRQRGAARLLLAVPVAPADTLARLAPALDAVHCLATPRPFGAVGAHYRDFHQLDDGEVLALLG